MNKKQNPEQKRGKSTALPPLDPQIKQLFGVTDMQGKSSTRREDVKSVVTLITHTTGTNIQTK